MNNPVYANCPVFDDNSPFMVTNSFNAGSHGAVDIVGVNSENVGICKKIVALEGGIIRAQRTWVKTSQAEAKKAGTAIPPAAGNCVYIVHADGSEARYMHFEFGTMPSKIKDGAKIEKGEFLGYMGNTGESYGAHLHLAILSVDGTPVDPLPYLLGHKIIGGSYKITFEPSDGTADEWAALFDALHIPYEVK